VEIGHQEDQNQFIIPDLEERIPHQEDIREEQDSIEPNEEAENIFD
jgi:hypothetical protein